ncbi:MAG: hypothetical protein ACREAL_01125 [Nitrosopumilaceae archaeon]
MTVEIRSWLLVSIFIIFLIPASYVANADNQTSWDEESQINVLIVGNSVINLDSDNKMLRAYVDIVNHDPSDGYYYLRIIQPATDKIISEEEIIIREKSNDKAGADIAHMFNAEELSINGTVVLGDYKIEIFSQKGNTIGTTTFSIIKPSMPQNIPVIENPKSKESNTDTSEEIVQTDKTESAKNSIELESELENVKHIPDWVKNIFILYADSSITENELISALKFLIEQGIIEIN